METMPTLVPKEKVSQPYEEKRFVVEAAEETVEKEYEHTSQTEAIKKTLDAYKDTPDSKVLDSEYEISPKEAETITLRLIPEEHDEQMSELLGILQEKGIKNTLTVVQGMNNPHLLDDFERFLVEYIKAGFEVKDLSPTKPLAKGLHMTLFEILLPQSGEEQKELKEILSGMEQLYAGMFSLSPASKGEGDYFTLEIAVTNVGTQFSFYTAIPDSKVDLFEKQLLSVFPHARLNAMHDDYNIFGAENSVNAGSIAQYKKKGIYPLKLYETFDRDPLTVLLNSFSKINHSGEGAALQFVFTPETSGATLKTYQGALEKIKKGVSPKEALAIPESGLDHVMDIVGELFSSKSKKKKDDEKPVVDETLQQELEQKVDTPIIRTNIRLLTSADNETRAETMLTGLESAFNQFENTHGNSITFKRQQKAKLDALIHSFVFRLPQQATALPLNLKEATTLIHLPNTHESGSAPELKRSKALTAPAPHAMGDHGILLGTNTHRNVDTPVHLATEDRLRHVYTIGQTGTGKSTLLKNMIMQDIRAGEGVCMIDPHGNDVEDILGAIPPERFDDVIYFDPSHTEHPMGLNMLEYDTRFPEQKTLVVNEMLAIFNKLFDMKTAGGPMFEQYFRNATLLALDDPTTPATLLDITRVLSVASYREEKLRACKNPVVVQFWKEIAQKAQGESSLENIVPYITSKFDTFLSDEIMRPIISQKTSVFNFRDIMDSKKIFLANLSKGRLGEINSHLIGLILVSKILMAALSRSDSAGEDLAPFYFYIDEFQNVTTDSIATILSEARKYKLSLNIAHQFIGQLSEDIKKAVFGNVGSLFSFRVGADDAEYLEQQFAPTFSAQDLMNLDNHNAYASMLVHGERTESFNLRTQKPPEGNTAQIIKLKQLSYLTHGRDRGSVEREIARYYREL